MTAQKYQELAREWLNEEVDRLAAWLEAHAKEVREKHGDNETILVSRNNSLGVEKGDLWTYGNVSFEVSHGTDVL